jgi:hypothetical protein
LKDFQKKFVFRFCTFIREKWQKIRQLESTPFEIRIALKLFGKDS